MYLNTGYLNHSHMDFKDKSHPLIVGSCGTLTVFPDIPNFQPTVQGVVWIIRLYISLLVVGIFILIM